MKNKENVDVTATEKKLYSEEKDLILGFHIQDFFIKIKDTDFEVKELEKEFISPK